MMRLSTLWRVDATVDAEGTSPVAERILERWAHDRGSDRFVRSSANFVYRFREGEHARFLRFADAAERSRDAVAAEMDLVRALAARGLAVAAPVPSLGGNFVETVDTEWGTFHAVVFPALEGEQFEIDELDAAGVRRWGAALGALHAALSVASGTAPDLLARPTWHDRLEVILRNLPPDSPGLRSEYEYVAGWLAGLPEDNEYGTIHGDFELDNLIWRGGVAGILDFDDSVRMWYAADVACAVRDLFAGATGTEPGRDADTDDPRFRTFVEGYREHRALDVAALAQVPLFLRFARLLEYARIVRALDLPAGPEHEDWLTGLRDKLTRHAANYRAAMEARQR